MEWTLVGRGLENAKKVQASLSVCEVVKVPFATGLFLEVLQRAWAFPFWGAQGQAGAFPVVKQSAPGEVQPHLTSG